MSESEESNWTPVPGEVLSKEEAAPIIAAFERRFRINTQGKHPKVPTWVAFDTSESRRANPDAFESTSIPNDTHVFLYFEGRELRRTKMADVRHYVASLEPWEDWDLYVFDARIAWCIALTHPQMGNERLVIVAGAV